MTHATIKLSVFWFILRMSFYNICISSLSLSGVICSFFLLSMELVYLVLQLIHHIKFKYYRTKIISIAKILQSISLSILLGTTFALSMKSNSKELDSSGQHVIMMYEPTDFYQNFCINLMMVAIALEIISAII